MSDEELMDAIYLASIAAGGRDESFDRMHGRLLEHHRGRGTRQADRTAAWQARGAWLIAEGYTEAEAALRLGVSLRSIEGLTKLLRSLYVEEPALWRVAA